MRKYPITFRIYPENKSLYWKVFIWKDKESMLEGFNGKEGDVFEAICSTRTTIQYWTTGRGKKKVQHRRKKPSMGEIHFHLDFLGIGVVTHEFSHASISWARRIKINPMAEDENAADELDDNERFAMAQGKMVRDMTGILNKKRIW